MSFRKRLVTALAAAILGLATTVSIGASATDNHTMYLTFNQPVALPGVSLGTGTYIFEMPEFSGHNVVRVLSRDRKLNLFTGLTHQVDRPTGLKRDHVISFAEAPPNAPQPIAIWWPDGLAGRQFIYPTK